MLSQGDNLNAQGNGAELFTLSESTLQSGVIEGGSDEVPRSAGSLSIAERGVTPQKWRDVSSAMDAAGTRIADTLEIQGNLNVEGL